MMFRSVYCANTNIEVSMFRTFACPRSILVFVSLISSCSSSGDEVTVQGGQNSEGPQTDFIPFVVDGDPTQLQSIFVSVRGVPEYERGAAEGRSNDTRFFEDRSGGQWRKSWGLDAESFLFGGYLDFPLAGTEPRFFYVYRHPACSERCTLQIRASETINWSDTSDTAVSWENRPDEWLFAEVEYNHDERMARTRLVEYNEETWDAVVDVGIIRIRLQDRVMTAAPDSATLSGYNRFRSIRPNPDVPDAGIERTSQERE
jgi:hypothetical protein